MRIAVLNKDKCKPRECSNLCIRMCPCVRMGEETIVLNKETNKAEISEELCTGCGICVRKCPFGAIHIVNLPEEVGDLAHRYGKNGFALYNLPTPKLGIVGIIGSNGTGKSTALKILSGKLSPNLGNINQLQDENKNQEAVLERFKGKELGEYFSDLISGKFRAVYKAQYVEAIPRIVSGVVSDILERGADDKQKLYELIDTLNLKNALNKKIDTLSGGELQKVALAAALSKDADIYLIDEPSSYLDVRERLNMVKAVRTVGDKMVFVVEHDLVVLDYLSDYIEIIFGKPTVYGIVSTPKSTRVGINEYLEGFLKAENMRFREPIKFDVRAPGEIGNRKKLIGYPGMSREFTANSDKFSLNVQSGELYRCEITGILGPNATGKTTFMKMLAGVLKPDNTEINLGVKVSYKPQYITPTPNTVRSLNISEKFIETFDLGHLLNHKIENLSGGELQKTAIAKCLSQQADIYLFDEPSAYLDIEQRLKLGKTLKNFSIEKEVAVMVVEHDILLVDYLGDQLIVFGGESGKNGVASKTLEMRKGMNKFLKAMEITFRRDMESGRPRVNKQDSIKDRQQKMKGEFYYI